MTFTPTTWNQLDKSSEITLSNGDLTASSIDTTHWRSVRSVYGASSGKYYFEILCGSGYSDLIVGLSDSTANLDWLIGWGEHEWSIYNYNDVRTRTYHNGSWTSLDDPDTWFSTGDIIGIALDLENGELYFSVNGNWFLDSDPETRTNPSFTGVSGTLYATVCLWPSYTEPVEYATANFGGSAFSGTVPTGYTPGFYLPEEENYADEITISDFADSGHEDSSELIFISDVFSVSKDDKENLLTESIIISDYLDVLNWTNWIALNYARTSQRFYFTLTGAADGVDDIEIPISSFQIRSSGTTRYISVEIPSTEYASEINLRTNGTMVVERAYFLDGTISMRDNIASASLDGIRIYEGGASQSITLDGYSTATISSNNVALQQVQTRQITNGALSSVRCAGLDFLIRPGDTCKDGIYEMTADTVIHTVSASQQGVDAYVDITAE